MEHSEPIEHIDYAMPLELLESLTQGDRAYWRVKCPHCGDIHERLVSKRWEDDKDFGGVRESHYFVCMVTGFHFAIQSNAPFDVVMKEQFRKPHNMVSGADLPDVIPF